MHITANWIWRKISQPCYNDTIVAKQQFQIARDIRKTSVAVTADSFYRLFVNDQWVCDGPARGWPEHYYYDQPDISRYLLKGTNEIKLIACYYGVGHFHGIPQQPGLLAQIDIEYTDGTTEQIVTDQSWHVSVAAGWHSNTPKISCQMGPAEYYDAGRSHSGDEPADVICGALEGPWQDLRPRDVKMLTRKPTALKSFIRANVLQPEAGRTWCVPWAKLLYPDLIQANRRLMPAFALAVMIETESEMNVAVNVTDYRDGNYPVFIDGRRAVTSTRVSAGQHLLLITSGLNLNHTTDVTVCVRADGSFRMANLYDTQFRNPWTLLAYESFKCAEDDLVWQEGTHVFNACGTDYLQEMETLAGLSNIRDFVGRTSGSALHLSCEVMFARDNYHRFVTRQEVRGSRALVQNPENLLSGHQAGVTVLPSRDGDVELIYDLGRQNIGYFAFEMDAEAGVEVDIYMVEYITPEGTIQFPDDHRNGMTYVTRAGRNTFTSLKRRSGRYVFIRFTGQTEPVQLNRFELIESTYPVEQKGAFACSDNRLNEIWDISARTLNLCMEDTFTDCPLYEQTLWVGDARNESLFAYGVFGTVDIAKRCIRLAAQSLERFEMVSSQLPSSWHCILPAWSFLWGISVWDYYWYTKDEAFLAEIWPSVCQNLKGATRYINEDGLFSADFWNLFDWAGIDQDHETVLHNSMFMMGAIDAAIQCGEVLDQEVVTNELRQAREKLKAGINRLWQPSPKAYPDSIHEDGTVSESISQHTSFLALLYDIAESEMTESLMDNVLQPSKQTAKVGSPFAMLYLYEMLDKYERGDMILKSIYESYLPMLEAGATTVWESFNTGTLAKDDFPTRSHCHAWSSAPLYFLQRAILGIRQTSPGCESFEISPYITDLDWAKGAFATPKGPLEVSWCKDGKTLAVSCKAPAGVQVSFKENKSYTGYKLFSKML